ncbi:MAG: hypothetical protein P8Y18_08600 [Candidatus Bathyarchaeota archaeon]
MRNADAFLLVAAQSRSKFFSAETSAYFYQVVTNSQNNKINAMILKVINYESSSANERPNKIWMMI